MTTAPKVARKRQVSPTAAAGILAARDPVIARLLVDTGPPRLRRFPEPPFAALSRAIVYQQLAGSAARRDSWPVDRSPRGRREARDSDHAVRRDPSGGRAVSQQSRVPAGPRCQGARRNGEPVSSGPVPTGRRRDHRSSHDGSGHRSLDVRSVPPFPAPPPGYMAGRRPRSSARLRAGMESPDAECPRPRTARRAVPPVPVGVGLVLLAGRRSFTAGPARVP